MGSETHPAFSLLAPPYRELLALDDEEEFPKNSKMLRGAALFWRMSAGRSEEHLKRVAERPGGLSLLVMLPRSGRVSRMRSRVLEVLEVGRPYGVLPHHPNPSPAELRSLLRAEPDDLAAELLDFLWWRGLRLDRETRRLVRKTVELSSQLTTLSALARGVYISRRALGRRFQRAGIPVPSHWLQFSRLLHAVVRLQSSRDSLFDIALTLGYPDGFTLSSQMDRMVGVRPSFVRKRLGWEWFVEAWLLREWEKAGLRIHLRGLPTIPARTECGLTAYAAPESSGRSRTSRNRTESGSPA